MGGPSAAQPQQQQQPAADLLGDIFGGPSPAPQATAPAQVQQQMPPPYTPQMITTADFGGAWGQLPHEKSIMMNVPSINNPDAYKQVISSKLGFYPVEVINNEVISSGLANSMGGQVQVLLHCRVEANG